MKLRLHYGANTESDIIDAAAWYENERAGLGEQFVLALDALIERIRTVPQQFPRVRRDVRKARLFRFPFAVYFRVIAEEVEVIAVIHQHRDPRTWQRRT